MFIKLVVFFSTLFLISLPPSFHTQGRAAESQDLLQDYLQQLPDGGLDENFYRTLPQIRRKAAIERTLALLQTEKVAPLRLHLIIGMGLSGSEVFFDQLIARYQPSNLATREAILQALYFYAHRNPFKGDQIGKIEEILSDVFSRSSYVSTAQTFVESGLLLAGKLNSEKSRGVLSKFYEEYAASDTRSILFLFRDSNRDHLLGTLAFALALSDLGKLPVYQRFMEKLDKAPQASIFAARGLVETGKVDAFGPFKPLLFNASAKTEIRLLTAQLMPAKDAIEILDHFNLNAGIAKKLELAMLRSASLQTSPKRLEAIAIGLLKEEDVGLKTEGILILARSKNRPLKGPLMEALEQKPDILTRILLAYASEEIELS